MAEFSYELIELDTCLFFLQHDAKLIERDSRSGTIHVKLDTPKPREVEEEGEERSL